MGTHANLELRLADKTLRRSVSSDGYMVSRSIVDLAILYDENPEPSIKQFKEWFKKKAEEILPHDPYKGMVGGNDDVIIDPARRLVTHTGFDECGYEPSDKTTYFAVRGAVQYLEQEHNYQFIQFSNPGFRKFEREMREKRLQEEE